MQAMLGSTASVGFATRWQLPSPPFPVKSTHLQGFCATQMSSGNVVSSGIQPSHQAQYQTVVPLLLTAEITCQVSCCISPP